MGYLSSCRTAFIFLVKEKSKQKNQEGNKLSRALGIFNGTVGKDYLPDTLNLDELEKLDYENPFRHQGQRHPRTAVSITTDNHFLYGGCRW